MRHERTIKIIEIVVLVFAIVGISIGFAAYAKDLTINIGGTVAPEDTFSLQFSNASGEQTVGNVTHDTVATTTGASGSATISGDGHTISTVDATFKKPGDTVVIKFYVTNTSIYTAYLKSITFSKTAATCTGAGVAEETRNEVCGNMSMNVSVGTNTASYDNNTVTGISTNNEINAKSGTTLSSLPVTLTLTYGGSTAVDSSIDVEFGSIALGYSTSNS